MAYIQIIELTTTRLPEIEAIIDGWTAATQGKRTARRSVLTEDRDRPNTYVQMVEFSSYEDAMTNSSLPETGRFAEQLAKLCEAPPTFRNLDVRRVDELD